ncbi:hypothetical protein D3C86_1118450 [compost metagenome]
MQLCHILQRSAQLCDTLLCGRTVFKQCFHSHQALFCITGDVQVVLDIVYFIRIQSAFCQFFGHTIPADFVQLINGHCNVGQLFCRTTAFCKTCQHFAAIDLYLYTRYIQAVKCIAVDTQQFCFIQQGIAPHHIGITLPELAVAASLRTIGTPYRLHLVAFKRESQIVLVHYHITGKWYGQIVA